MHDPNRIEPFIAALYRLWYRHPDWRFGQLLYNTYYAAHRVQDLFYLEDDVSLKEIERWLEKDAE